LSTQINALAGKPAQAAQLVDVAKLVAAVHHAVPDGVALRHPVEHGRDVVLLVGGAPLFDVVLRVDLVGRPEDAQLQTARPRVDDEHTRRVGATHAAGHFQSRTSGMSSPNSCVYSTCRVRASTMC
jgi:hypothetical protein